MSNVSIKNDYLKVTISTLGAEIQSVENLDDHFQYIWNDKEKKYWQRHAPILFPFIGRSNENAYLLDGKKYPMSQHGFLRDQKFSVTYQDQNSVTLRSDSNTTTLKKYPFYYTVKVNYSLEENHLNINYVVENRNDKTMYYSLGFHPGFNIESNLSDYSLQFNPGNTKLEELMIGPAPFRSGEIDEVPLNESRLFLSYPMLDNGLIILNVKQERKVILANSRDKHEIEENISDFPYLAIWSPEKKSAPFVCVEPFKGLPDKFGKSVELKDKDAENQIAAHGKDSIKLQLSFK